MALVPLLTVATLWSPSARADALLDALLNNVPSSASVEYGAYGADASSVTVSLDLGLPSAHRVLGGFSNARDSTDTSNAFWIGAATDPLATLNATLRYERNNSSDLVYSDTVDVAVTWSPSDWDFGVFPSYRRISIERPVRGGYVRIDNPGFGVQVGYNGWRSLSLTARHDQLRYYSGVESLDSLTTAERNVLAWDGQPYVKRHSAVTASYRWLRVSLGAELSRSVSVIDDAVERRQTVDATLRVTHAFNLRAYAGRARDSALGSATFGGVGCVLFWE